MNLPNKTFCVLPWVSLEASPIGTVRPCCLADDELVNDAGEKFSLLDADFAAIQNSTAMTQLREQQANVLKLAASAGMKNVQAGLQNACTPSTDSSTQ